MLKRNKNFIKVLTLVVACTNLNLMNVQAIDSIIENSTEKVIDNLDDVTLQQQNDVEKERSENEFNKDIPSVDSTKSIENEPEESDIYEETAMLYDTGLQWDIPGDFENDLISYNDYEFRLNDKEKKEVELIGTPSTVDGDINLPGNIIVNGKTYILKAIGNTAFRYKYITSITIPNTVDTIGDSAFYNCSSLKTVNIEDNSVTKIGKAAFAYCSSLDVKIPEGVKKIGESAFSGCNCSSFTTLVIPESVTEIDSYAFSETNITSVKIPDRSTSLDIKSYTFSDCKNLVKAEFGKGVQRIENYAFGGYYGCPALETLILPDTLTYISQASVFNDNKLKEIIVNDSEDSSYYSKDGVLFKRENTENTIVIYPINKLGDSYTIPDGTKYIADSAFRENKNLVNLTIPESVESIGENAFRNNEKLSSLTIPYGLKEIGADAFTYSPELTKVVLPSSLTSIGTAAFANCSKLEKVIIPDSVKSIGNYAFYKGSGAETRIKFLTNKGNNENLLKMIGDNYTSDDIINGATIRISADEGIVTEPKGDLLLEEYAHAKYSIYPSEESGRSIDDIHACYIDVSYGNSSMDLSPYNGKFSFSVFNLKRDIILKAEWKVKNFSIDVTHEGSGKITLADGSEVTDTSIVEEGGAASFKIVPDSGNRVKDVIIDGVSKGIITSYNFDDVKADHTIAAIFEKIPSYAIEVSHGENGKIILSDGSEVTEDTLLQEGQGIAYKIVPDSGYKVKDVVIDGVSKGALTSYKFSNVTSNHTIYAEFEKKEDSSTGNSGGSSSGGSGSSGTNKKILYLNDLSSLDKSDIYGSLIKEHLVSSNVIEYMKDNSDKTLTLSNDGYKLILKGSDVEGNIAGEAIELNTSVEYKDDDSIKISFVKEKAPFTLSAVIKLNNSYNNTYMTLYKIDEDEKLEKIAEDIKVTNNTISFETDLNGDYLLVKQDDLNKLEKGQNVHGEFITNESGSRSYIENGSAIKGWKQINGSWYMFDSQGEMLTGWFKDNSGIWYYLNEDGTMRTGWTNYKNQWYYLTESGAMMTNWLLDNGQWYYLDSVNGDMSSDIWKNINGEWYYFYSDGHMACDTIINGYKIGSNGAWIR